MAARPGDDPPEFYAALDPGIREVVRYLRQHGFATTDSGDGVTKPKDVEVLPFPHVAVHSEVYGMIGNARLLLRRIEIGAEEGKLPPGGRVELTFDPADELVVLFASWPAATAPPA
jgi:hypothetical protein